MNNNTFSPIKNILPLFGNPVIKKINVDKNTNKYNFNNLNPNTKLNSKKVNKLNNKTITFNKILGNYLKALNLYKTSLNNTLFSSSNRENPYNAYTQSNYPLKNGLGISSSGSSKPSEVSKSYMINQSALITGTIKENDTSIQSTQNKLNNNTIFPSLLSGDTVVTTLPSLTVKNVKGLEEVVARSNTLLQRDSLIKGNKIKISQTNDYFSRNDRNEIFNSKFHSVPLLNNIIPVQIKNNNSLILPNINEYIKSMSIFNMKNKGILINYNKIIGYNFSFKSRYTAGVLLPGPASHIIGRVGGETNKLQKNIYEFLAASFYSMYSLISKPVFVITPDKITIQLFYYLFIPNLFKFKVRNIKKFKYLLTGRKGKFNRRRFTNKFAYRYSNNYKYRQLKKMQRKIFKKLATINLIYLYPKKFKKICIILSRLFNKPVELDLIRLHYPYNDSNILVNLIGIMINKIKVRIIMRKLFRKAIVKNPNKINRNNKISILPAFLSGMKIRIAGRLLTQKVVPRKTVKVIRRGAIARGKINFSDVSRLTKKNKRGAFSITITSGQNFK